jgi:uncharacterized protein (DUF1330 family)
MPVYVIAQADVTDPEKYAEAAKAAPGVLEEAGGRFLARGTEIKTLEGDWQPPRMMLIEFPDMDAVSAWYDSDLYQKAKDMRAGAAELQIVAIESA